MGRFIQLLTQTQIDEYKRRFAGQHASHRYPHRTCETADDVYIVYLFEEERIPAHAPVFYQHFHYVRSLYTGALWLFITSESISYRTWRREDLSAHMTAVWTYFVDTILTPTHRLDALEL